MKHKGGIAAGMLAAVGVVAAALTMKSSSAPPKVDEDPPEEAETEAPESITETRSSVAVVEAGGEMTDAAATGSGDESGAAAAPGGEVLHMATEQQLEVSANAGLPRPEYVATATPLRSPSKEALRRDHNLDLQEAQIRGEARRALSMTTDGATPDGLPQGVGQRITTRR